MDMIVSIGTIGSAISRTTVNHPSYQKMSSYLENAFSAQATQSSELKNHRPSTGGASFTHVPDILIIKTVPQINLEKDNPNILRIKC